MVQLEELLWRKSMYWLQQVNNKNCHPCHNLPQTCRGSKSKCPVRIRPTENLLRHLRTGFRINELWTNKYDTHKLNVNKKVLNGELRRYFRSCKEINWSKQVLTTNQDPFHDLTETCGGSKSVCPVWIRSIDNLQSHTRTSFRINEHLSDQCEQIGQQSTRKIWEPKTQIIVIEEK